MVGDRRRLRRRRGMARGVARVVAPLVVVAAVVILAVGAVSQVGPASGPDRRTVDRSFAVLAGPIVARSNASGAALSALMAQGPTLGRPAFFGDLDALRSGTAEDERELAAASSPAPGGDAARGCGAGMAGRNEASARVASALEGLLGGRRGVGGGDESAAARALEEAGTSLRAADSSWAACRKALRREPGTARLPASKWISDPGVWGATAVGQLVAALVASGSLAPVHHLNLTAASTDPSSVPSVAGGSVLPPTFGLHLRFVLVNQGNVDEDGVRITVRATPGGRGPVPAPVRVTAEVGAGESTALSPPALAVRPGRSYTVEITATAQSGTTASLSVGLQVSVVPTTTTTTTTPPTTTTRAPGTSTTTGPGRSKATTTTTPAQSG